MNGQNREESSQAGCSTESGKPAQDRPSCCGDDLPSQDSRERFRTHVHDLPKQKENKPSAATCDCPPGCVGLPCCH